MRQSVSLGKQFLLAFAAIGLPTMTACNRADPPLPGEHTSGNPPAYGPVGKNPVPEAALNREVTDNLSQAKSGKPSVSPPSLGGEHTDGLPQAYYPIDKTIPPKLLDEEVNRLKQNEESLRERPSRASSTRK